MNKILVEIYVPALMRSFEAFIPTKSKVYDVLQLIEAAVRELSDGSFQPDDSVLFCERNTGIIYNINMSIEQIGLENGSQLMLV